MDIVLFILAGIIMLVIAGTLLNSMGLKEFLSGLMFALVLVVLVFGVLRGAANMGGHKDKTLPEPLGALEELFQRD